MHKKLSALIMVSAIFLGGGSIDTIHAEEDLLVYVNNIQELLEQTKKEYAAGNVEEAKRLAMKAYIDNYEYLEDPVEAQNEELKDEVEIMLREELQVLMRNNASSSEVDAKIDKILEKMELVAAIVPEFGPLTFAVLLVSILSVIIVGMKISAVFPNMTGLSN